MIKNHFLIAWRNLRKNKFISLLNIGGLSAGMAVALMIGLWIMDEISFDRTNENYDSIAQLARKEVANGEIYIADQNNHFPIPLAAELRSNYANYLQQVALTTEGIDQILSVEEKKFTRKGMFVEPSFTKIFTLKITSGAVGSFDSPNAMLVSQSLATALFGQSDPVGQTIRVDNRYDVKVSGVYEDLPQNNRFANIDFLCPFNMLVANNDNVKQLMTNWENSSFFIFLQAAPGVRMDQISAHISDVYWSRIKNTRPAETNDRTTLFLHPMRDWHLRSEWKNGVHAGGQIRMVWLFGIIGAFVLLLACINFMNLSTARAGKRSREVGIRKTFGSQRGQLVRQFLSESLVTVLLAFGVSVIIVMLSLEAFNTLAGKHMVLPFRQPMFWIVSAVFIGLTALLAGSYPAAYLSSFQPATVLKGSFRAGGAAAAPRRVLAGIQFTVSIILIIATVAVYKQIQYAQNRPAGYDRNGLIRINSTTPELAGKYAVLQQELVGSGAAISFAESSAATTENNYFDDRFEWEGKNPKIHNRAFTLTAVTEDYGKTVGWKFISGRDFSNKFKTDNAAIILNESAVQYMQLRDPVGKQVRWNGNLYTITGVIRDMITSSPFKSVQPGMFFLVPDIGPVITIRLNPALSSKEALARIEKVFAKLNPSAPFAFSFVDEEYGRKFAAEQRIGVLSALFATLAIFISCLGIFGLAAFVAQQRTREISMRKLLGAPVVHLWSLLTREFVFLIAIAFVIAAPVAHYITGEWLEQYEYRTIVSWWVYIAAGMTALVITLLTVSYHAIRAAMVNPIKNLRVD